MSGVKDGVRTTGEKLHSTGSSLTSLHAQDVTILRPASTNWPGNQLLALADAREPRKEVLSSLAQLLKLFT